MYHILVCTYFILGEPAIIWSVVCQKFVFYFTENLKEEPKHKDPVTKTQSFRQNRMKVSAPIPSVEDIATIKHKKKVCLQRTSAKN